MTLEKVEFWVLPVYFWRKGRVYMKKGKLLLFPVPWEITKAVTLIVLSWIRRIEIRGKKLFDDYLLYLFPVQKLFNMIYCIFFLFDSSDWDICFFLFDYLFLRVCLFPVWYFVHTFGCDLFQFLSDQNHIIALLCPWVTKCSLSTFVNVVKIDK